MDKHLTLAFGFTLLGCGGRWWGDPAGRDGRLPVHIDQVEHHYVQVTRPVAELFSSRQSIADVSWHPS